MSIPRKRAKCNDYVDEGTRFEPSEQLCSARTVASNQHCASRASTSSILRQATEHGQSRAESSVFDDDLIECASGYSSSSDDDGPPAFDNPDIAAASNNHDPVTSPCTSADIGLTQKVDVSVLPSLTDITHVDDDPFFHWLYSDDSLESYGVKGRIKAHIAAWQAIDTPKFLLSVIENGYCLPLRSLPPSYYASNNQSAHKEADFVLHSVGELVKNGCARLVTTPPHIVNPLQVAVQSSGKKRLILDLTYFNRFLFKQSVRLDELREILPYLRKGGWVFVFDIFKAYYGISIHKFYQTFLGFSFTFSGKTYYGVYTVMPFGLSTAVYLYCKFLKPWIRKWRSAGATVFVYIDDGLGYHDTREKAIIWSQTMKGDLTRAGFILQDAKCTWNPVQSFTFLGFNIDLRCFYISVPAAKLLKAHEQLISAATSKRLSARKLLSIAGLIASLQPVFGNASIIFSKPFYMQASEILADGHSYGYFTFKSQQVQQCICFWLNALQHWPNERNLCVKTYDYVCFSDASDIGGASLLVDMERVGGGTKMHENPCVGLKSVRRDTKMHENPCVGLKSVRRDTKMHENPCVGLKSVRRDTEMHENPCVGLKSVRRDTKMHENPCVGLKSVRRNTKMHVNSLVDAPNVNVSTNMPAHLHVRTTSASIQASCESSPTSSVQCHNNVLFSAPIECSSAGRLAFSSYYSGQPNIFAAANAQMHSSADLSCIHVKNKNLLCKCTCSASHDSRCCEKPVAWQQQAPSCVSTRLSVDSCSKQNANAACFDLLSTNSQCVSQALSHTAKGVFCSTDIRYEKDRLQAALFDMGMSTENVALVNWTADESCYSSTWRELKAVQHGLESFVNKLQGKAIMWYTDNKGVTSIVRKGSMKPDLQVLAEEICLLCRYNDIALTLQWVPRLENVAADRVSRWFDSDDWKIHPSLFTLLGVQFGTFDIDRFASDHNTQLLRFNSRFNTPGSEAIDAFTQDWSQDYNWLCPPPKLIPQTINHLVRCHARGVLVVPSFPSAMFWPLLFPDGKPAWFVSKYLTFPNAGRYILPGRQPRSIFGTPAFHGALVAFQMDASLASTDHK